MGGHTVRRIVLAACATLVACTLVGILLGAYLHEIGIKPVQHHRDAVPAPSTTVSTTVSTVTVEVTPQQAAQRNVDDNAGHPVVNGDVAPPGGAHPGNGTPQKAPKSTSDDPTTHDSPTTTTTTHPKPTVPSVPCHVGHRRLPPICVPTGHRHP